MTNWAALDEMHEEEARMALLRKLVCLFFEGVNAWTGSSIKEDEYTLECENIKPTGGLKIVVRLYLVEDRPPIFSLDYGRDFPEAPDPIIQELGYKPFHFTPTERLPHSEVVVLAKRKHGKPKTDYVNISLSPQEKRGQLSLGLAPGASRLEVCFCSAEKSARWAPGVLPVGWILKPAGLAEFETFSEGVRLVTDALLFRRDSAPDPRPTSKAPSEQSSGGPNVPQTPAEAAGRLRSFSRGRALAGRGGEHLPGRVGSE